MTISIKHIAFTSIIALSLIGCSSNDANKPSSEHGLIDQNTTIETNTTNDQNNTGGSDNNGTTGGANDQNSTGGQDNNGTTGGGNDQNGTGGSDNNSSTGSHDNNGTANGGNDQNHTGGGNDNNGSTGNDQNNTGGSDNNSSAGGGSDNNSTTGGGTDTNATALQSLTLTVGATTLNKDHNTTLQVQATYRDKSTKDLTDKVQWLITPSDAVKINGHTLTALKDVNVTLRAKYQGKLSNPLTLSIYWEVKGHRLPPEPDPKINNSTLLGVDVNHNDVRDDVERWIYEKYKDKHPIYIDIAMQAGRAYKLVLEHPEKAKEIRLKVNGPYFCGSYYMNYTKIFHKPVLVHERIDTPVKSKYFNTEERKNAYWKYDTLLSGDSYDMPWADEMKALCDFNTSKYDKE